MNKKRKNEPGIAQRGGGSTLDDPQWMGSGQSPVNQVKIQFWTLGCVHKNRQSKQIAVTNTWESPFSIFFLFYGNDDKFCWLKKMGGKKLYVLCEILN